MPPLQHSPSSRRPHLSNAEQRRPTLSFKIYHKTKSSSFFQICKNRIHRWGNSRQDTFLRVALIKVSQYILDYALESKGLFFFFVLHCLQTEKEICIGIRMPLILFYCSSGPSKHHISYTNLYYPYQNSFPPSTFLMSSKHVTGQHPQENLS